MKNPAGSERVRVVTKILQANDRVAEENRHRLAEAGVCLIDVIGSPGAGKTALLEASIPALAKDLSIAVIVGDICTTHDADRLAAVGVPAVQINTEAFGGSCHLEASTVRQGLDLVDLESCDLLFVENVGNLVCPAEFDIGHHARVVVYSVTEGEDKPLKYPLAFRAASLVAISKMDLCPHQKPDMEALHRSLEDVHPQLRTVEVSARTGTGLDKWREWVRETVAQRRGMMSGSWTPATVCRPIPHSPAIDRRIAPTTRPARPEPDPSAPPR